jgi:glycerol kinase
LGRAIVWQDRRTAELCAALKAAAAEPAIAARTGLLLDPYFSATKISWILDYTPGARARAERGKLAFGTVDSYLLWRLTGGAVHATDATNASRTLLFDIHKGDWDDELLALFKIPRSMLPEVKNSSDDYGTSLPEIFGAPIAIRGVAGDQQAATVGQACFVPGMMKSTYGTGCFALLNTGATPVASKNKLLTTIAYQLDGKRTYALEGSIFVAGAAVQWLRDELKIIASAEESGRLAKRPIFQDVFWFPPSSASVRRTGIPTCAGRCSVLRAPPARRSSRAPRSKAFVFRPPIYWTPCAPTGPAQWTGAWCCASTAAWRSPTGPCSASPTS